MIIRQYKKYLTNKEAEKLINLFKEFDNENIKLNKIVKETNEEIKKYNNSLNNTTLSEKEIAKEYQRFIDSNNLFTSAYEQWAKAINENITKQNKIINNAYKLYVQSIGTQYSITSKENRVIEDVKETLNSITKKTYESWCNQNTANVNGKKHRFTNKNGEIKQIENESQEELITNFLYFNLSEQFKALSYYSLNQEKCIELVNEKAKEILGIKDLDITQNLEKYYVSVNTEISTALAKLPRAEGKSDRVANRITYSLGNVEVTSQLDSKVKNWNGNTQKLWQYCLAVFSRENDLEHNSYRSKKNQENRELKTDLCFSIRDYAKLCGVKVDEKLLPNSTDEQQEKEHNRAINTYKDFKKELSASVETIYNENIHLESQDHKNKADFRIFSAKAQNRNGYVYLSLTKELATHLSQRPKTYYPNELYKINGKDDIAMALTLKLSSNYYMDSNILEGTKRNKVKVSNLVKETELANKPKNLKEWKSRIKGRIEKALDDLTDNYKIIDNWKYVQVGTDNKEIDIEKVEKYLSYEQWTNLYIFYVLRDEKDQTERLSKRIVARENYEKNKKIAKQRAIKKNLEKKLTNKETKE